MNLAYFAFLATFTAFFTAATAHATVTSSSNSTPAMQRQAEYNLRTLTYKVTCNEADEDCEKRIIKEINQASKFILYQTDEFKSRSIAKAIANASNNKGMITEIILSVREFKRKFTAYPLIAKPRIVRYVYLFEKPKFNKAIIIDGTTLILHSNNIYTIIKNNPIEINKYIKSVLQYRKRSQEIK